MTIDESVPAEQGERDQRDERWYLTDEREFLQRSLADAEREREAGDLSAEDHAVLVGRDTARLAKVEKELAALDVAAAHSPVAPHSVPKQASQTERVPMARWRRFGIVGACLLIALGAVILVVHFVQARQPGQASSGSVTVSQAQQIEEQLAQATSLDQQGSTKEALVLYNKVLAEDPSNPAALAYAGFLQWNVGTTAHVASLVRVGRAEIETAMKDAPTYFQAHLFDGLILANQDHDNAAAVAQFNDFLADSPPAAELPQAAGLVAAAYQAAGVPLPSQFTTTTTTTTSAP